MPVELKDLFVVTVNPDTESARYLEMREYSDPIEDIISLSNCISIAVIAFDDQQPPFLIRAHSGPLTGSQSEGISTLVIKFLISSAWRRLFQKSYSRR